MLQNCFELGDKVCIKRYNHRILKPCWKGPHTMILTMPMAVKVDGKGQKDGKKQRLRKTKANTHLLGMTGLLHL